MLIAKCGPGENYFNDILFSPSTKQKNIRLSPYFSSFPFSVSVIFFFFFGKQELQLKLKIRVEAEPLKVHANKVIIQKHRHVHWGIIINPKILFLSNSLLCQKVCTLVSKFSCTYIYWNKFRSILESTSWYKTKKTL